MSEELVGVTLPERLSLHPYYAASAGTVGVCGEGEDAFQHNTARIADGGTLVCDVTGWAKMNDDPFTGDFGKLHISQTESLARYLIASYNMCQSLGWDVEEMERIASEDEQ